MKKLFLVLAAGMFAVGLVATQAKAATRMVVGEELTSTT
jgi:hypothetical protein